MAPLKPFQTLFVAEYLRDFNASASYRRLKVNGTQRTAEVEGSKLLRKPEIQAAIQAAQRRAEAAMDVSAAKTLQHTAYIAYGNPADLFDDDWHLKPKRALTPGQQALLASIEIAYVRTRRTTNGKTTTSLRSELRKYKTWSKVEALKMLHRYQGLDKMPVEAGADVPVFALPEGCRGVRPIP